MAVQKNTVWYYSAGNMSSTGYYAITQWAATTAYTVGLLRRQLATPTVGNERVFICIIAGTSGGTEPAWTITRGAKTASDGTVTWMETTGVPALNSDSVNTPLSSQNRSGAQVLGNVIQNNAGTYYFICTTAGTTGSGEPSYVLTVGSTTTDSSCVWTCISAVGAYGAWAGCHCKLGEAVSWAASGDTIYVSSTSAETQTNALTCSYGNNVYNIYCIDSTNFPPQTTDLTTGASITVLTGAAYIPATFGTGASASIIMYGFTLAVTSGNNSGVALQAGIANCYMRLVNCKLSLTTGGGSGSIGAISLGSNTSVTELVNTSVTLVGNQLAFGGSLIWRDTPSAITVSNSGAQIGNFSGWALLEGVDLSGFTGATLAATSAGGRCVFSGCKLPTSATTWGNIENAPYASSIDFINCDTGGSIYRHERWGSVGNHVIDTTAVHTGGASDGTTPIGWRMTTGSGAAWNYPLEAMPITIWWSATNGPSGNVVIQCLYAGAALPYNDGIWLDTRYTATASSTLLTCQTGTKANVLATHTQYTASTAAWDSIGAARLNSHAYTVGQYFTIATNPGQLFIVLTAGTSAGSLPGAYSGVADGVTVTDSGMTARALVRFALSMTLSPLPQSAGYLRCYVRAALPSAVFWIDPLVTLS